MDLAAALSFLLLMVTAATIKDNLAAVTIKRKEIMEEEIVCNRERDLADERITITNIKISSSSTTCSSRQVDKVSTR